jgi:hypothetical protein
MIWSAPAKIGTYRSGCEREASRAGSYFITRDVWIAIPWMVVIEWVEGVMVNVPVEMEGI